MSETPSPFPLAPLSKEQINSDPTARREAMRRLVALVESQREHWQDVDEYFRYSNNTNGYYGWLRERAEENGDEEAQEKLQATEDKWVTNLQEWLVSISLQSKLFTRRNYYHPSDPDNATHRQEVLTRFGLPNDPELLYQLMDSWRDVVARFRETGIHYVKYGALPTDFPARDDNDTIYPATIPPEQLTHQDIIGMMVFGNMHPQEMQLCDGWWQGATERRDALLQDRLEWWEQWTRNDWRKPMRHLPDAIAHAIEHGDASYDSISDATQVLHDAFIKHYIITNKRTRYIDANAETPIVQQIDLCAAGVRTFNPNGMDWPTQIVDNEWHYGFFAHVLSDGDDTLAQLMLSSGLHITEAEAPHLMKLAMIYTSLDTVKALHATIQEAGIGNISDMCYAYDDQDYAKTATLFHAATHATDPASILPKIDWLMGQGLDGHQKFTRPLIAEILEHNQFIEHENKGSICVDLLRRGFGKIVEGRKLKVPGAAFSRAIASASQRKVDIAINAYKHDAQAKVSHFLNHKEYIANPDITPLAIDDAREILTPGNLTPQDLITFYSVDAIETTCTHALWQGHEEKLFTLHQQLPKHIQREIEEVATPTLVIGATKMTSAQLSKPLANWQARVSANDDRAPAQAASAAIGGG